ncbi:MAG: phospholipase D-like domain-containing protein [Bacteroidales bacterium]|nr:phospholipase D-like domain-containing protein [Bacteroidales bacterium]
MEEVKFLFDNQLIAALEDLIKKAKNSLLLVSPFIDLDKRIQGALNEHKAKHDFELLILFGKNEDNYYKSIKKDSLDFLKQFPNVEIRYNDRLHAKFYQNDFKYIMTSLNLYNYSLANNIEVGVICKYASKGLIGKVMDSSDDIIYQGVEKVRQGVFGKEKEVDPIEEFQSIFENSELKYKTKPIIVEKGGIQGVFGGKKLSGFKVVVDNFSTAPKFENIPFSKQETKVPQIETVSKTSSKTLSASQLSKSLGISLTEIINLMQKDGFIDGDKITELGRSKGLIMKRYMGNDYIAYPENLDEFSKLVE